MCSTAMVARPMALGHNMPAWARARPGSIQFAGIGRYISAMVAALGPLLARLKRYLVSCHADQQLDELLGFLQVVLPRRRPDKEAGQTVISIFWFRSPRLWIKLPWSGSQ
jgi:hypothetical protein